MGCETRMSMLSDYPIVTSIFGTIFVLISITAFSSNLLVLVIIKLPGNFTKSNKILASLAVADLLVGLFLSPITAWQILDSSSLRDCNLDKVRVFLSLALSGSSTVTLAVVALDRYILLTRLTKYRDYLSNCKLITLLAIAWLLPIAGACVRFAGRYPYLTMVMICRFGPLIVLVIIYVKITLAVKRQEQKLLKYQQDSKPDSPEKKHDSRQVRKTRSGIRLAKAVTILIVCYLICVIPLSCWAILGLINIKNSTVSAKTWQFLYISSITLAYANSSINPIIYFLKTPTFKKGLRKIFGRQTHHLDNSTELSNSKTISTKI